MEIEVSKPKSKLKAKWGKHAHYPSKNNCYQCNK